MKKKDKPNILCVPKTAMLMHDYELSDALKVTQNAGDELFCVKRKKKCCQIISRIGYYFLSGALPNDLNSILLCVNISSICSTQFSAWRPLPKTGWRGYAVFVVFILF